MGKRIIEITTVMIVLLIISLVIVFISLVNTSERTINNKVNNVSGDFRRETSGDIKDVQNDTKSEKSGENIDTIESGEFIEIISNAEDENNIINSTPKIENTYKTTEIPSVVVKPTTTNEIEDAHIVPEEVISGETTEIDAQENNAINNNPVESIISSDTETSNQDKQQVLSEIDSALQGLLEAVGNVPIVDEEKLNKTLESSEVTP